MAGATLQEVLELIKQVQDSGKFEVADLGNRWRVTNPQGGTPVFINRRPPRGNTLKVTTDALAAIGFIPQRQAEAAEEQRQARLASDRERNEEKMRAAVERANAAAERVAARVADLEREVDEAEHIRARRPERAEEMASRAPVVLGGYRKDYITVDLDLAQRTLREHNIAWRKAGQGEESNRNVDPATITDYAQAFACGWWGHSHQGVAIDKLGRFVDGQQRYMGLVLANEPGFLKHLGLDPALAGTITFQTEITYDVDPEAVQTMDRGRLRTRSQMLGMRGEANSLHLDTALKLVHLYLNVPYDWGQWVRFRMPPSLMWATLVEHGELRGAVSRATRLNRVVATSSLGTLIYLVDRDAKGHEELMEPFLEGMRTGADLSAGDPRLAMRSLRENRRRGVKINSVQSLALLIKAWNAYLAGRVVGRGGLRFRPSDEGFPRLLTSDSID